MLKALDKMPAIFDQAHFLSDFLYIFLQEQDQFFIILEDDCLINVAAHLLEHLKVLMSLPLVP